MKLFKSIFILLLALTFFACDRQTSDNSINELTGTYQYVEDSGVVTLRNWGKNYWELNIKKEKSSLSYFECGRGLSSFSLSVNLETKDNKIHIKHDSIISNALFLPTEISDLEKGNQIMVLEKTDFGLITNSHFLTITVNDSIIATEFQFVNTEAKLN